MTHHGAALRKLTHDDDLVRRIAEDWRTAGLDAPDAALAAYAEKLTLAPWKVGREDVEALRAAGFDDRAILDACQVVCYFNFVTRLADGLGVDLEPYWTESERL